MQITDELRVVVEAEVDRAVKNLEKLDKQTSKSESTFEKLGKSIASSLSIKAMIDFGESAVQAWNEQEQSLRILESTVKVTGASAWTTSQQLQQMADSFQSSTNYDSDAVIGMQSVLLGFKNIRGDIFGEATGAILDMATVMKMDLASAAQAVGKALDDPINGIDSLRRQGFQFSDSQKRIIQDMISVGDQASAQKIILNELTTTYGGASKAAANSFTQTKNNIDDIVAGYGKIIMQISEATLGTEGLRNATAWVADAFANFDKNFAQVMGGNFYTDWYDSLADTEKLKEATIQLDLWKKSLQDASGGKKTDQAVLMVDGWRRQVALMQDAVKEAQRMAEIENNRIDAENKINELLYSTATEYEKLGKDDPVKQIESYRKSLEQIANDRAALKSNTTDIDVSGALTQLDYIEQQIYTKIAKIQDDGKKSWQQWFEEITGVAQDRFGGSGAIAGELFVESLESSLSADINIAEKLGNTFNLSDALQGQQDEIQKTISKLLSTDQFSLEDNVIDVMAKKYQALGSAIRDANYADEVSELQKAISDLGKSESDLAYDSAVGNGYLAEQATHIRALNNEYARGKILDDYRKKVDELGLSQNELALKTFSAKGATQEEIEELQELIDTLESSDDTVFSSLGDMLTPGITRAIEEWGVFDSKVSGTLGSLSGGLIDSAFSGAISGIEQMGVALAQGEDAAEVLKSGISYMAAEILNNLPTLFLNAGLQLISQGQWALGLGLMAAGGFSSFLKGYTNEAVSQASKGEVIPNASGGAYDTSGAVAFAKGGTFTNSIVSNPTLFRFAQGTGLMGEAGPEAIMPLTRTADGSLGIRAVSQSPGDGSQAVVINIINNTGEDVTQSEKTGSDGTREIEIIIGSTVAKMTQNGQLDGAMKSRYGIRPVGV
jgi:hypothetical protein